MENTRTYYDNTNVKHLHYLAIQKQALIDKYQWRYEMYKDAKPAVEKQCRGEQLTEAEKMAIKKASVPEQFTSDEKLENIREKLDITKESLDEARQELYFVKEQIKENLSSTDTNTDSSVSSKKRRTDDKSDSTTVMSDSEGPGPGGGNSGSGGGNSGSSSGASGSGSSTSGTEGSNFVSLGDKIIYKGNNSTGYFDINILYSYLNTEGFIYFFILIQVILPFIKIILLENYRLHGLSYNLFLGTIRNIYFLLIYYITIFFNYFHAIFIKYKSMFNKFSNNSYQ